MKFLYHFLPSKVESFEYLVAFTISTLLLSKNILITSDKWCKSVDKSMSIYPTISLVFKLTPARNAAPTPRSLMDRYFTFE